MAAEYLMYCASVIYFCCYVPEMYANYKNKNVNIYNIPEKVMMLIGTSFALSYSLINNNPTLLTNYGPLFAFDIISVAMRLYYANKNGWFFVENKNGGNDVLGYELVEFLGNKSGDVEDIIGLLEGET